MKFKPLEKTTVYRKRILWELPIQLCAKDFIKKGDCVFDVGANIGGLTIAFSRMVGEGGQVHAFEPNPKVYQKLKRDLLTNSVSNVKLVTKGVWSKTEKDFQFYLDESSPYGVGSSLVRHHPSFNKTLIDVTSIDDYCEQNNVIPKFIKIDAEGAEFEILMGAKNTISNHLPILVFEYSPLNDSYDLLEYLFKLGYHCMDVNLYQEVNRDFYLSNRDQEHSYNIIALPSKTFEYSKLTIAKIDVPKDSKTLSTEFMKLEEPGRYIIIFDIEVLAPRGKATLKIVSGNGVIISAVQAGLPSLKTTTRNHLVIETERPFFLKCTVEINNPSKLIFKGIKIVKIIRKEIEENKS